MNEPAGLPAAFSHVRFLARGAFGEVYRATDAAGRDVAVKTLSAATATSAEVAWQFASEFRRLTRLSHPAFPRAYEEGRTEAGLPYYTMEFVEGEPLAGPLAPAEVAERLAALAEALAYMHGLGLVHGDLKPENVRRTPEGRLVLLDVGLTAPVGQKREAIAGTPEYLAPEVFRLAPVDPASDLYALGVLAYELWTGRAPFTGPLGEVARAHLTNPPPPMADRRADPALERLVLRLLSKAPSDRPGSAVEVLEALGRSGPVGAPLPRRALRGGDFIDREGLLAAWRERLAAGRGALRFGGRQGLGKSRALNELRLLSQLAGRAWVGAASSGAADAPAGPVRAAVGQALAAARLEPSALVAAWLAGRVPETLATLEPNARKAALNAAAAQALADAAAALGGLCVGLDDWHLADSASNDFMTVARSLAAEAPLVWALALEPAEPAPDGFCLLSPFDPAQASALVASRLGEAPPTALLEQVLPVAAGSPLLLDLLLEHLAASGALEHRDGAWRFDPAAALKAGALPTSLEAVWAARLSALEAPVRRLAAAAAVAAPAGELPLALLAEVAGLAADAAASAAEMLLAEGLLVATGGRVRLAMPAMAAPLGEAIAPAERAAWAEALARAVLAGRASEDLPPDELVKAARLALAGGDDALAAELAAAAGRLSLSMAAPSEALALLEAAGSRWPAGVPALAVVLPRAEARRLLNQPPAAAADYEEAIALAQAAGEARSAARAGVGLAKCQQMQGAYDAALATARQAEASATEAGAPDLASMAALVAARVRMFQGAPQEAIVGCRKAAELARAGAAPPLLAQALTLHGALWAQVEPAAITEAQALVLEALAICERLGDRTGMALALEYLGNTHLSVGDLPAAEAAFARFAQQSEEIGNVTEAVSARMNQAIAAGERGALTLPLRLARDVAAAAAQSGRKYVEGAARATEGQALWRAGRPEEAFAALEAALALAVAIKNRYLEEHVRLMRLEAWLAKGQTDLARVEAEHVAELVAVTGHAEGAARLEIARAEAARQSGAPAQAVELATPRADDPNRVVAHQARQVLAGAYLALGEPQPALEQAEAALAIARDWRSGWHEAWDLVLVARARRALGESDAAAALASEVLALPDEDAHPYARAGAAALIAEAGGEPASLDEAIAALQAGLAPLEPEARRALFGVYGLSALEARPAPSGGALDPARFGLEVDALFLETGEQAIAEAALSAAMAMTGAERGYLLAYENGRLRSAISRGLDLAQEVAAGFSSSIAERVLFSNQPLYVADATSDQEWREAASVMALSLKTVICLPFATPAEIVGVLYMDRPTLEPILTAGDLALLGAYARVAATLALKARGEAEAQISAARMAPCLTLATRLAVGADPTRVRQETLSALQAAAGAERAFWLRRVEADWEALAVIGASFSPGTISRGAVDWALSKGRPLCLLDASQAEGWQERQSVMALGLRTIWCLPAGEQEVVYLDTQQIAAEDPEAILKDLEAIVGFAVRVLDAPNENRAP